jgi:hypothetical protein
VAELVRASYERELGPPRAFLPSLVPPDQLPSALVRFLDLCAELPQRFAPAGGGVRAWLDGELAHDDPAARRAIAGLDGPQADALATALSVLGHTYRWDTVPPAAARFDERTVALPPGLAGPWSQVARSTGQPRVGTAWTLHLNNWRMADRPGGSTYATDDLGPHSLRIRHTWLLPPVDAHLEAFSLAFVVLEARGADVLRALVEAVEEAAARRPGEVLAALERAQAATMAMTLAFSMSVRKRTVDPATWLELVQPTFAWAAEVDEPGLIEGGPSGMQLGTIQALDAVLGITGRSAVAHLARAARRSMPAPHRRLLATLDGAGPVLRSFVARTGCPDLTRQFDACISALGSFRATHLARGARYLRHRSDGDGPRASTGLTIGVESDAVATFEQSMTARIVETRAAVLGGASRPLAPAGA